MYLLDNYPSSPSIQLEDAVGSTTQEDALDDEPVVADVDSDVDIVIHSDPPSPHVSTRQATPDDPTIAQLTGSFSQDCTVANIWSQYNM